MIFIYTLIIFFLGIIFVQWIIPLIDGFINVILTIFEVWKGRMAVKITNSQAEVEKIKQKHSEIEPSFPIGFMVLNDNEEEDSND